MCCYSYFFSVKISEKTVLPADAVYSPRDQPRTAALRVGTGGSERVPGVAGVVGGVGGAGGAGGGARYSPGALQVRRAAVVLQPPTTV